MDLSPDELTAKRLARLEEILVRLASDAETQINYLRQHEFDDSADELALELDDVYGTRLDLADRNVISQNSVAVIDQLYSKLSEMSGAEKSGLWTAHALRQSPEWVAVRELARLAAQELRSNKPM